MKTVLCKSLIIIFLVSLLLTLINESLITGKSICSDAYLFVYTSLSISYYYIFNSMHGNLLRRSKSRIILDSFSEINSTGTRKQCWMSEVTESGIHKFFLSKSVKEKFWDQKLLSYVTGCRKTQVLDCTSSTVQYINTKPFLPCQSYLIENQLIDLVVKG